MPTKGNAGTISARQPTAESKTSKKIVQGYPLRESENEHSVNLRAVRKQPTVQVMPTSQIRENERRTLGDFARSISAITFRQNFAWQPSRASKTVGHCKKKED
jgi:hypothetical protein